MSQHHPRSFGPGLRNLNFAAGPTDCQIGLFSTLSALPGLGHFFVLHHWSNLMPRCLLGPGTIGPGFGDLDQPATPPDQRRPTRGWTGGPVAVHLGPELVQAGPSLWTTFFHHGPLLDQLGPAWTSQKRIRTDDGALLGGPAVRRRSALVQSWSMLVQGMGPPWTTLDQPWTSLDQPSAASLA